MNKEYILNFLKEHNSVLKSRYSVDKIGLIGSYAKGFANEKSDIDFYVVLKNKTLDNMTGLWLYLEKCLNKKVDLIYYHSRLRKGLKKQIEDEVIYA